MQFDLFEYDNYSNPKLIINHKKSIISHYANYQLVLINFSILYQAKNINY
jgi:hypothetical protein